MGGGPQKTGYQLALFAENTGAAQMASSEGDESPRWDARPKARLWNAVPI